MAEASKDNGPMTLAQAKRAWSATVKPFKIEFGDENCRNQSVNTLKIKVRGAWSVSQIMQRPEGARDIGEAMAKMPANPGQQLIVIPEHMMALVKDPLEDDAALLKQIERTLQQSRRIGSDLDAVPESKHPLNPDTLKTLCCELLRKQQAKQITVIEGKLPTYAEMEKLPGRELNDPWNSNPRKPKYKDQVSAWENEMERTSQ